VRTIEISHEYGISPRFIGRAIVAGSLFAACGAPRSGLRVDAKAGGTIAAPPYTGTFRAVDLPSISAFGPYSGEVVTMSFDWSTGGGVTVMLDGGDELCRLRLTHEDVPDERADEVEAWWRTGVERLMPGPGRLNADATERQGLEDWLDYHRTVIPAKLRDVSETDARRRLVPSETTLLGLAKHLIGVERNWFAVTLDGQDRESLPANNRGNSISWELGPDETIASVLDEYARVCAESRALAARYELEQVVEEPDGPVSMRTLMVHMIEETARHNGHADILREQIDASSGSTPA
jgi:uncharacterized damage-inducible protein DinB